MGNRQKLRMEWEREVASREASKVGNVKASEAVVRTLGFHSGAVQNHGTKDDF